MAAQITVLQLDPEVPLDRAEGWLTESVDGTTPIELTVVEVWHQPLPDTAGVGDGLVVLGGRMSAHDQAHHRWIEPVKTLLVSTTQAELPVLAICLGHQLLAEAYDGQVSVSDARGGEHGPVDLTWLPGADGDPVAGALPDAVVPMSHHDVVTRLPHEARPLARTGLYEHAAFRVGTAIGVQFHPEASPELMGHWAALEHGPEAGEAMMTRMREADAAIVPMANALFTAYAEVVRQASGRPR